MLHLHLISADQEAEWTLLFVAQSGKRSQPLDLQKLVFPDVIGTKGLVVVAPVKLWVGGTIIIHYRNLVRWVAIHEPDLKGAVVILSQARERVIGEVIPLSLNCLVCGEELRADAKAPYCVQHRGNNPSNQ